MSGPTPTPPSTPGHTPQRSYTVADPEGVVVRRRPSEQDSEERKPVNLRSGSVSGASSGEWEGESVCVCVCVVCVCVCVCVHSTMFTVMKLDSTHGGWGEPPETD